MENKRQPALIIWTDGVSERLQVMPTGWWLEVLASVRRDILDLNAPLSVTGQAQGVRVMPPAQQETKDDTDTT